MYLLFYQYDTDNVMVLSQSKKKIRRYISDLLRREITFTFLCDYNCIIDNYVKLNRINNLRFLDEK